MRLTGDWTRHAGTQAIFTALAAGGHRALFVGGCVRNAMLGAAVSDVDIATEATPKTVTMLAEAAGMKVVPTGIAHGTVTVIAGGLAHEVTTFRRDVETDGRHATVAFSTSVAEDARRRDFTMNALYATADGTVVDPLDGLADLCAGHVRFVGDPAARIAEDYLRILRFFRFTALYGSADVGIDAEGLAACAALAAGLDTLSRERVGQEMRKLLAAPDPAPAVAAMAQTGILARVLPGASVMALGRLVHLEAGRPSGWTVRRVVLGGNGAADDLRLSNRERDDLGALRTGIGAMSRPAELGWRHGEGLALGICLARAAVLGHVLSDRLHAEIQRGAQAVFPVRANDLMPRLHGKTLGDALRTMQARWIASDFTLSREDLVR